MKSRLSGLKTIFLSLIVMALFGSLFPFIKIGYQAFSIDGTDVPSVLMFAGTRFTVCGIVIYLISLCRKDKYQNPKLKTIGMMLLCGVFSTILHYAFTYIGLGYTDSSKSAIIKQIGTLMYVCFAFLFFKEETFSVWKIIGAVLGFVGIIAINFNAGAISFSIGDILIILASFCTVISSILSKKLVQNNSPFLMTGTSQLFGGIVLMIVSAIMGADMLVFNWNSFGVFSYICFASTVAYVLWNYIMRTSELSNMFIIKFAEPLFACIFGAILLRENIFQWQYLIAFILISVGIVLGNKTKKEEKNEGENICN